MADTSITPSAGSLVLSDSITQLLVINDNQGDTTTTFDDQSAANRTVTVAGAAQYDIAQAPTGMTSSMLLDGTTDYISVADAESLDLGAKDFAIELPFRVNGAPSGNHVLMTKAQADDFSPFVFYLTSTSLQMFMTSTGVTWDIANAATMGTVSGDTWYTAILSRIGTSIQGYLGETRGFQATSSASLLNTATSVIIGAHEDTTLGFNGWVGPVRITIGDGRGYLGTTTTPPSFPFVTGATGAQPTVSNGTVITPSAGALTLTSVALGIQKSITPSTGSLSLAGAAPVVESSDVNITPSAGNLSLSSNAPTVSISDLHEMTPTAGALTLTGAAPDIVHGTIVEPANAVFTLTGEQPQVVRGTLITSSNGALSLNGTQAELAQSKVITPSAGTLSFVGSTPSIIQNHIVTPNLGSLTAQGEAPSAVYGLRILPSGGAITIVGEIATSITNHLITPLVGGLTLASANLLIQNSGFEREWLDTQLVVVRVNTDLKVRTLSSESDLRQVA